MANPIKPKRSYTANSVPLTTDLATHELAINWTDGKAFTKNAAGQIVSVTLGGSGGGSGGGGLVTAATPAAFPATGSATSLYVATDSQQAFRWDTTNSVYVEVGPVGGGGSSSSLTVTIPGLGDPYWSNVSLLLNCNGSNGSTTFTDSSDSAVTVTAVGNAQVSTSQKKFGTGSAAFDGSGDYLSAPVAAASIASNQSFAIEMWIYLTAAQSGYRMLIGDDNGGQSTYWAITATGLEAQFGAVQETAPACSFTFSQNTWYHVALSRDSSNTVRMYVNGIAQSVLRSSQSAAFLSQGSTVYVGSWGDNSLTWHGRIDEIRITKNSDRGYTSSTIPVPTAAFPNA